MSYELWTAVDHYFDGKLVAADPALEEALKATVAAGIPSIQVSATQGKLLHLLARIRGASRILEVGTLGGYSTIWLARALPADGRLVTLEVSPRHAAVATANVARAGLADVVDIRVGPALDTLPKLLAEAAGPFDLVFIDADKVNNPAYFQWAVKLTKPGSVIIVDNVVREGQVANPDSQDPSVVGTRELHDLIAAEPRVSATAVQTVGNKGYDGFTLALVVGE
ncbi:O-methyltransferase [Frankia sp. AgB1.9]|uniref:O-methyltransferase n=1 Tax=unclassified Frankia TaxID=2632575 RepID=UPI001931A9C8|nr:MULTISPECIES: O-methyltransferase [unclassified Frankia]MBL7494315.1 O-methyltransferase [Frankia sp. AgW1.1]MBL7548214.1 O-methyltransferase [Frankia sp. AgB1.9]MBL7621513.1 O-methyltransferase [Frankia sp. AgB1.8]